MSTPPAPTPGQRAARQRQALCHARNQALRLRFQQLYHTRRLRLDDAYRALATEFYLSERTVVRLLKRMAHDAATPPAPPSTP